METRVQIEFCPCTQADYECEYGFYRQPGSLNCIRNPYIPPLDPCTLPRKQRQTIHQLGYRLIPGDRCIGGWQPPIWNQTILDLIKSCPYDTTDEDGVTDADNDGANYFITHNPMSIVISIILLTIGVIVLLFILWNKTHHHRLLTQTTNYHFDTRHFKSMTNNAFNHIHDWFVIPLKRNHFTGFVNNSNNTTHNNNSSINNIDRISSIFNDSRTVLWPPTSTTTTTNATHCTPPSSLHESNTHSNQFKINYLQSKLFSKPLKTTQINHDSSIISNHNHNHNYNHMNNHHNHSVIIPKKSIIIPTMKRVTNTGLRQYFRHNDKDVTNLLEAEEIPSSCSLLSLSSINNNNNSNNNHSNDSKQLYDDPLSSCAYNNSLT
ncbi:unnamed protein product, partial [Schistosoma turkestanicum]